MLKHIFAGLVISHGAIHAIGFIWAWDLTEIGELGGPTILFDSRTPGDLTILVMGGLWLLAAIMFVAAGIGISRGSSRSPRFLGAAASTSLVVTVIWWNDAYVGAILSAAILLGAIVHHRRNNLLDPEPQPTAELFVPQWWRSTL